MVWRISTLIYFSFILQFRLWRKCHRQTGSFLSKLKWKMTMAKTTDRWQHFPGMEHWWLQDIQHNGTQHNDIQHNDAQHNNNRHNDTQHNDIQYNGTQHNDIQHNGTQHNGTQHNEIQYNGTQYNDIQYNVNKSRPSA